MTTPCPPPPYISLSFLQTLTDLYNIWHTIYWSNLQQNNYCCIQLQNNLGENYLVVLGLFWTIWYIKKAVKMTSNLEHKTWPNKDFNWCMSCLYKKCCHPLLQCEATKFTGPSLQLQTGSELSPVEYRIQGMFSRIVSRLSDASSRHGWPQSDITWLTLEIASHKALWQMRHDLD